jgi:hypothetical protein
VKDEMGRLWKKAFVENFKEYHLPEDAEKKHENPNSVYLTPSRGLNRGSPKYEAVRQFD